MSLREYWSKLSFKIETFLAKMGFISKYDFGGYKARRNTIILIMMLILVTIVLIFFIAENQYKAEALEEENSKLFATVENLNSEIQSLGFKLEGRNEIIQSLKDNISLRLLELNQSRTKQQEYLDLIEEKKTQIEAFEENLKDLDKEKKELESQIEQHTDEAISLKETIRSSVRASCCSFSEVEAGIVKRWSISDNNLVCTGNLKVHCGTGVADFPE